MWRMICTTTSVTVTIEGIEADNRSGRARIHKIKYNVLGHEASGRQPDRVPFPVPTAGIVEHRDACDARQWAEQAIGGVKGWLAGRVRPLRAWKAAPSCGRTWSRGRRLSKGGNTWVTVTASYRVFQKA